MHFRRNKIRCYIVALLTAVANASSSACSVEHSLPLAPGAPSQLFSFNSDAGGGERTYLLHLPATYKQAEPNPLILAFHGKDQTATTFENETQFSNPEFNDDAVVIYPQGLDKQWTGDPASPPSSKINDVHMVYDLLSHLHSILCISDSDIHAVGFSNGGGLTDLLACSPLTSPLIASFATTSAAVYLDASLPEPLFGICPSRIAPVPQLRFHGTSDPVIDYRGKGTPDGKSYAVPERMREWAEKNGCKDGKGNVTTSLFGGKVMKYAWSCGGWQDVVTLFRIEGFGHGFPTTTPMDNDFQRYGPTYFNATPIIMDFFQKWPLKNDSALRSKDEL